MVYRFKHRAWHILFDDLPTPDMFARFLLFLGIFGAGDVNSNLQRRKTREWIRENNSRVKKYEAWRDLFTGLSIRGIISEINRVWIDPAYEIEMGIRLVKKLDPISVKKKK